MARLSSDNQTSRFLWLLKLKQQSVQLTGHALPREIHPRVCGERLLTRSVATPLAGSSPRVRGTPAAIGVAQVLPRFIPACAGNAHPQRGNHRLHQVHPRVCGERLWLLWRNQGRIGSSPPVRGTRSRLRRGGGGYPVHPRVCGERSTAVVR